MKKHLYIALLALSTLIVKGQSLQFFQLADSLPSATSYTFNLAANDPQLVYETIVKNVTGNSINVKVRKTIISTVGGHDAYFCFGTTCYVPTTVVSNNAVTIAGGQQLPSGTGTYGIRTEFDNNGVVGSTVVKYTAFDIANTSDTAVIYITYNVNAVGIQTYNNAIAVSNVYPNPAVNQIELSYDLKGATNNASVKIYNALGSVVKTISLNESKSSKQIDVSDLEEGFYFYNLISEGKKSATKKFVVSR